MFKMLFYNIRAKNNVSAVPHNHICYCLEHSEKRVLSPELTGLYGTLSVAIVTKQGSRCNISIKRYFRLNKNARHNRITY